MHTSDAARGASHFTYQKPPYCIKAGHAVTGGSILNVEKEEDVNQPHDAVKGRPTPGTGADVWLLGYEPE